MTRFLTLTLFELVLTLTFYTQVGLDWETIEDLDEMISELFCVRSAVQEREVDRFLTEALRNLMKTGDTHQSEELEEFAKRW